MGWKMVMMDLDGTLLRSDKTVSDYTVEVLERCKERGILVAFATARSEQNCKWVSDQVKPDVLVTCGGARARMGERTLYRAVISEETANGVLRCCRGMASLECITADSEDGCMATDSFTPDGLGWVDSDIRRTTFEEHLPYDFYKIVVNVGEEDGRRLCEAFPQLNHISFTGEPWHSMFHRDADKWKAIQAAAQELGIPTSQIVAFGDEAIDVGMLTGCGMGVAVANAVPAAVAAADARCGSNDEDGVARWLEANVLCCGANV